MHDYKIIWANKTLRERLDILKAWVKSDYRIVFKALRGGGPGPNVYNISFNRNEESKIVASIFDIRKIDPPKWFIEYVNKTTSRYQINHSDKIKITMEDLAILHFEIHGLTDTAEVWRKGRPDILIPDEVADINDRIVSVLEQLKALELELLTKSKYRYKGR